MEDNKGKLVASNEAWTLDLPKLPHRHKAWRRRPIGHTGEGWICSADNANEEAGVTIEGAFLILSQFQDVAWDAMESLDYIMTSNWRTTTSSQSPRFLTRSSNMRRKLKLPERCQEFFEQFPTRTSRRTPSISGSAPNNGETTQGSSCWVAPADASWHPKMDSPTGAIDLQWWADNREGQPSFEDDVQWW